MADISKLSPGPVEKPGVPGRVAGGHFASGANNVASAKEGAVGEAGPDNSVSSHDKGFHYQDYAERRVDEQPEQEQQVQKLPVIDGSGLNKAPVFDLEGEERGTGILLVQDSADLATRAVGSYQSAVESGQPDKPAPGRQLSLKL